MSDFKVGQKVRDSSSKEGFIVSVQQFNAGSSIVDIEEFKTGEVFRTYSHYLVGLPDNYGFYENKSEENSNTINIGELMELDPEHEPSKNIKPIGGSGVWGAEEMTCPEFGGAIIAHNLRISDFTDKELLEELDRREISLLSQDVEKTKAKKAFDYISFFSGEKEAKRFKGLCSYVENRVSGFHIEKCVINDEGGKEGVLSFELCFTVEKQEELTEIKKESIGRGYDYHGANMTFYDEHIEVEAEFSNIVTLNKS